jgi:hypothetical protein
VGNVEKDGAFPVVMKPLDMGEIQEKIKKLLSARPTIIEREFLDLCMDDGSHSNRCTHAMKLSEPCFLDQVDLARRLQKNVEMLGITKWGRDPSDADVRRLFEGMAAKSLIYEAG